MAVIISTEPLTNQAVGNPLVFQFYEDTAADFQAADYYFEIELYLNTELIGTYRKSVISVFDNGVTDDGYGKFDCSDILETYINNNTRTDAIVSAGSFASYQVKITPFSNGVASDPQVTSTLLYTWKARLTKADFLEYINGTIFTNTGTNTKTVPWLTQFPSTENYYVALDEDVHLFAIYKDALKNFNELRFELFDSSGVSITTATYTFTTGIPNAILANVSPDNIIAETSITTANFSTCAYYTVTAWDDTGTPVQITDTYTFHIDLDCTRYEKIRLYFLSKIGTIDSFTCKLVNRKTVQTKTESSESIWGEYIADGTTSNDYTFDLEQGGINTNIVTSKASMKIETDWMNETVQNWLVENLYESPLIVMEQNDVFTKVNIKARNYEIKKRVNNGLIRETIQLELSHGNTSILL